MWGWYKQNYPNNGGLFYELLNVCEKIGGSIYSGLCKNPNLPFNDVVNHNIRGICPFSLCKNSFKYDRENYIAYKMKWLLLVTIYETLSEPINYDANDPYEQLEMILANDYLVKFIVRY